ncbi:YopX family protein [Lactiplantibacillus plantarum]|uniref:YopX family protein n=1 Tax=Lactiplantibacillus plantarum TaxID=1590 RepID=UPI0020119CC9|nr:YopX family protein [Lactiplantibacillus plantarum]
MIKFRAWDNENGFYLYNVQDAYDMLSGFVKYDDGENASYDEDCFGDFLDNERYVVEQFTGLKDVNGKEIYVGDIVQPVSSYVHLKRGKPFEVKKDNYIYGKWMANDVSDKEFRVDGCWFNNEIQTVGNVHENPELLEAGK